MRAFASELESQLRSELDGLTMLELALLTPSSADDRLLRDYVAMVPRRAYVGTYGGFAMVNGLPDQLAGVTLVPDWLEDDIYSGGARSGSDSRGPTAYLWLALEPHEEFAETGPPGLGLGEVAETAYPVELVLVLGDAEDARTMSFAMGHFDETRKFLALMLLTGRLIVDILRIDDDDGPVLLHRYGVDASTLIEALSGRVLAALRGAQPMPLVSFGDVDDHILGGFAASENAKSELLLSLDEDPAGESAARLKRARIAYLDAEVARVRLLHLHADTSMAEEGVSASRATLGDAWGSFRKRGREHGADRDPVAALRMEIDGLATERRALVHFNVRSGHLQGFWVAGAGDKRGWLSCEEVDLGLVTRAVEPWLQGAGGDADALVEAASPLAVELLQNLSAAEVDEAVIMPWAVLQGVPFGALRVGSSRLDDMMRISYSPSVRLLRMGERDALRDEYSALVSAHGRTLRWADAEVQALGHIYGCEPVVEGTRHDVLEAMASARIVHVASHGQWWREDHFASVLDLRSGGPIDRFVSAAEIHRDVSLRGADIIVLSACDTGRAPTDRRGIESYTGIDAAFLLGGARAVISTMWRVDDFAAMLFAVNFHALVSRGETVGDAFIASVHAVRGGGLDLDEVATNALDRAAEGWRDKRDVHSGVLRQTNTWATFKLSGPHWLAKP